MRKKPRKFTPEGAHDLGVEAARENFPVLTPSELTSWRQEIERYGIQWLVDTMRAGVLDEKKSPGPRFHLPHGILDSYLKGYTSTILECMEAADKEPGKVWTLVGWDTFASEGYPLSENAEHSSETAAREAARARLRDLEITQPSAQSGGQTGIQDQVWIVRPDGSKYRFTE